MLDEKIELLINGKKFANWFDLEVTLSVDSFDSIGFSAPFEPARKEFRDTFRPFSFAANPGAAERRSAVQRHDDRRRSADECGFEDGRRSSATPSRACSAIARRRRTTATKGDVRKGR
jgi:hypothetical protein